MNQIVIKLIVNFIIQVKNNKNHYVKMILIVIKMIVNFTIKLKNNK
jgi:hypothetical protein